MWLLDNNIYQYDGGHSEATSNWGYDAPRTNQFWEFHAAGDSGHWTQQAVITPPSRPPLIEIYQGYYASGNNLGFAIGGVEDDSSYYEYSDEDLYAWRRVPGIVMYNQSSQEWFNASTKDFAELSIQGAAHFVPNFGPEGILFGWYSVWHDTLDLILLTTSSFGRHVQSRTIGGAGPPNFFGYCVYV